MNAREYIKYMRGSLEKIFVRERVFTEKVFTIQEKKIF